MGFEKRANVLTLPHGRAAWPLKNPCQGRPNCVTARNEAAPEALEAQLLVALVLLLKSLKLLSPPDRGL